MSQVSVSKPPAVQLSVVPLDVLDIEFWDYTSATVSVIHPPGLQGSRMKLKITSRSQTIEQTLRSDSLTSQLALSKRVHRLRLWLMHAPYSGFRFKSSSCHDAGYIFKPSQQEGMQLDTATILNLLKHCSSSAALDMGRIVHRHILEGGLESCVLIGTSVINMYAKCGSVADARTVFDRLPAKDRVTWTAMIAAYAEQGEGQEALHLFRQMQETGMQPDRATWLCVLKACARIAGLEHGKLVYAYILQDNMGHHLEVGTSLVDMFAKCGSLKGARVLFERLQNKDLALWNAIISAYAHEGDGPEALQLLGRMQREGIQPNQVTLSSVLTACSSLCALEHGRLIRVLIRAKGLESNWMIVNTLIDLYVNCGNLEDAHQVFESALSRDLGTWNALLAGYADAGAGYSAIKLFKRMEQQGIQPNQSTFVSLLQACSGVAAALPEGKFVHSLVTKEGYQTDTAVGNSLIDMYAKCGSLEDAKTVFDSMPTKDLVSWNTMIAAYAQHGCARKALNLFNQMQQQGLRIDSISFLGLLTACSHEGLLEEGTAVFQSMSEEFHISPDMKHYACVVDLLGRRGRLYDAIDFIERMPLHPDLSLWRSLLASCRTHGNVQIGEQAYEAILKLDPTNTGAHVLMAEIYDGAGRYADKSSVRRALQSSGARKVPGRTWMELNSQLHIFGADDTSHSERKEIYAQLKNVLKTLETTFRASASCAAGVDDPAGNPGIETAN